MAPATVFPYCAIDFETTGSVPGFRNEPWQIGAVAVAPDGGVERARRVESLLRVDPGRPFNKWAPGRHGELRREIAASPTLAEFWPEVAPLMELPLVAHNAGTERSILAAAAPLHRPALWIDTLALSRLVWPDAPSYALEDLAPALGLAPRLGRVCPGRSPHDALYDAFACALVLETVCSLPGWSGLDAERLCALCSGPDAVRKKNRRS